MDPLKCGCYAERVKRLALFLLGAAIAAGLAAAPLRAQQQTFWTTSTGPAPSPWPTPSYWPAMWENSYYYPTFWPVCTTPASTNHCRPRNGHIWPPHVPPGKHPVPVSKPAGKPPR